MKILGISSFYHDSACCLLIDGILVAAAQEERFTRIKGDKSFPRYALAYCLDKAMIKLEEVDYVAFYENSEIGFERFANQINPSPASLFRNIQLVNSWGKGRLSIETFFRQRYPSFKGCFYIGSHHQSHAASAFYLSPFDNAAVLTIDGVGEDESTGFFVGQENKLTKLSSYKFPSSVGLFYSTITTFLGFKANSGEYKVMGLAPYGDPERFYEAFRDNIVTYSEDGSLHLNEEHFDFTTSSCMYKRSLSRVLKVSSRLADSSINQDHMDIAAALQRITEETVVSYATTALHLTHSSNICLAGGVALNCVANGILQRSKLYKSVWVQPASGDAGSAVGCAYDLFYNQLNNPRDNKTPPGMDIVYTGPSFSNEEVKRFLDSISATYHYIDSEEMPNILSDLIINKKIIGLFQGPMEFGPRALGNRSIIGDPRYQDTQATMNQKIKFRESFRPFAPFVLKEKVSEWFEDADPDNKYMLFVSKLRNDRRKAQPSFLTHNRNLSITDRLNHPRSDIPAVTHMDYSARIQSVSRSDNNLVYSILKAFYAKTNIPFLVNTSFNVRGEPIVLSPSDAYNCLISTHIDCLCIENFLVFRHEQSLATQNPQQINSSRSLDD